MEIAKSLTRRWFQFRLGKLLGAMAVVGLACGWWSDHVRQERRREYVETMLHAYQTRFETEEEELAAPFRNVGIGRGGSPHTYASAEEFIEDLRAATDWGAVSKVRWRAEGSGVIEMATPELIRLLKSPNGEWRERAAALLGAGGARTNETAVALAGALSDASLAVRQHAARALTQLDSAARPAAAQLAAALQDPEPMVRCYAADSLWKATHDPQAIAALTALLDGPASNARRAAIKSLCRIGPQHAASAAPNVISLLSSQDVQTRRAAMQAVARLAPHQAAVETLSDAFHRFSGDDRKMAAAMLVELDHRR
ncbi:MAG TPA: HEAT repeat domain-containing protein [Pirellulales bacterium]|nr:HEAT repeat domain-containing protein [Pirellulales bacterium]